MNVVADKSSTGLDANVAGALAYIPIIAIVFLVIEKGSRFVKFHAVQSLLLCLAWIVLWFGLTMVGLVASRLPFGFVINILLLFVNLAVMFGGFALWIIAVIKAFQGQQWKMPYIGDIAEQQSANL